jgi:hypothetical protein
MTEGGLVLLFGLGYDGLLSVNSWPESDKAGML